jgi:hypothetical protein
MFYTPERNYQSTIVGVTPSMQLYPRLHNKLPVTAWRNVYDRKNNIYTTGKNVDWILLIELNKHKFRACAAFRVYVRKVYHMDKRLLDRICEKYIIEGLSNEKYWEHLIEEPFLTYQGQLSFKALGKCVKRAQEQRRREELFKREREDDHNRIKRGIKF